MHSNFLARKCWLRQMTPPSTRFPWWSKVIRRSLPSWSPALLEEMGRQKRKCFIRKTEEIKFFERVTVVNSKVLKLLGGILRSALGIRQWIAECLVAQHVIPLSIITSRRRVIRRIQRRRLGSACSLNNRRKTAEMLTRDPSFWTIFDFENLSEEGTERHQTCDKNWGVDVNKRYQ